MFDPLQRLLDLMEESKGEYTEEQLAHGGISMGDLFEYVEDYVEKVRSERTRPVILAQMCRYLKPFGFSKPPEVKAYSIMFHCYVHSLNTTLISTRAGTSGFFNDHTKGGKLKPCIVKSVFGALSHEYWNTPE